MNIIDRVIKYVSPKRYLERVKLREGAKFFEEKLAPMVYSNFGADSTYTGAKKYTRSMAFHNPYIMSPAGELDQGTRDNLAARSRDAEKNQLLAGAIISRHDTDVVGAGLRLNVRLDHKSLELDRNEAQEKALEIEQEFKHYAESKEIDIERTSNFYQLQSIMMFSALLSGDCFINTPYFERFGAPYGTKIQLIEGERVSNENYGLDTKNLVGGVEFDTTGAPTFYHIMKSHPGDCYREADTFRWEKLPVFGKNTGMRRIQHLCCNRKRPGQKRGEPLLTSLIEPLKQLDRYAEAEIMAAVVSAMFTIFVKSETGEGLAPSGLAPTPTDGYTASEPNSRSTEELPIGSGLITDLAANEDIVSFAPQRPNSKFSPFMEYFARLVGARIGIPGSEVMLHYETSYSSARAAMLKGWKYYVNRRYWLGSDALTPYYHLWFEEGVARGRIIAPGFGDPYKRIAWLNSCFWIGGGKGAIDELKEAMASEKRVEIGISNLDIEAAEMKGLDYWSQVHPAREIEVRERVAGNLEAPVGIKNRGFSGNGGVSNLGNNGNNENSEADNEETDNEETKE